MLTVILLQADVWEQVLLFIQLKQFVLQQCFYLLFVRTCKITSLNLGKYSKMSLPKEKNVLFIFFNEVYAELRGFAPKISKKSNFFVLFYAGFLHSSANWHVGSKTSACFWMWSFSVSPEWRGHLFSCDLFPSAGLNLSPSCSNSSVSNPGHCWTNQTHLQTEQDGTSSQFCKLFFCRHVICASSAVFVLYNMS